MWIWVCRSSLRLLTDTSLYVNVKVLPGKCWLRNTVYVYNENSYQHSAWQKVPQSCVKSCLRDIENLHRNENDDFCFISILLYNILMCSWKNDFRVLFTFISWNYPTLQKAIYFMITGKSFVNGLMPAELCKWVDACRAL